MKKFYLLISIVMIGNLSNAQFTKGQKLVGPSLSFGLSDTKYENLPSAPVQTEKTQSFNVNIGVSSIKMKTESVGWGVGLNYGFNTFNRNYSQVGISPQKENNHSISLSGFKRKFIPIKPKFNFYYDIGAIANIAFGESSITYTNVTPSYFSVKTNEYGLRAYITPGFTYAIKKNLLIDAALSNIGSIGFIHSVRKTINSSPMEQKTSSSNFNASSTLTAGGLLNNFSFSFKWII